MQLSDSFVGCYTEDTGVLYDKLNVNSSSAADENPDSCVVVITGQWKVAHCTEQHLVVCQSDRLPSKSLCHYHAYCIRLRALCVCASFLFGL